jgi:Co/Zn/Cd efflux system component
MSQHHHDHGPACCAPPATNAGTGYRRALGVALLLNAAMFITEMVAGLQSGSVSLWADAADFLGDAVGYALALWALAAAAVWRSRLALAKGIAMAGFGGLVLLRTLQAALTGQAPEPVTMGLVALLALAANLASAAVLYAWREGDANMRAVWLCTRNDALGNVAVVAAALGVFGSGSRWPDLLVATGMAVLALVSARAVIGHARAELRGLSAPANTG